MRLGDRPALACVTWLRTSRYETTDAQSIAAAATIPACMACTKDGDQQQHLGDQHCSPNPATSRPTAIHGSAGSVAALLTCTLTAPEPSAFMITTIQLPLFTVQVSVWVRGPDA